MQYNQVVANFMARQMEREEQHEREREVHQAIHDRLMRLNEEELKAVLQFVRMVYRHCEDRQNNIQYGYPEWNLE